MSPLEFSRNRVLAFLQEIARLKECEFPYPHSQEALREVERQFEKLLHQLEQFTPENNTAVVNQQCAISVQRLNACVPLLGFVLRSTNVRNAFEVYGPLLRLCRSILEPDVPTAHSKTRLLLSSEWIYSPFVFREFPELPNFVLIGLPAQESGNPFLIPLAGHELGHSYWAKYLDSLSMEQSALRAILPIIILRMEEYASIFKLGKIAPDELQTNIFSMQSLEPMLRLLRRQAEESFCDYMGLRIFGASYLNAFAYIASPGTGGLRPPYYPNIRTRAANLAEAASVYDINCRSDFLELFEDSDLPKLTEAESFRLSVADEALKVMTSDLINKAAEAVEKAKVVKASDDETNRIYERFKSVVPADNAATLSDILNASWMAFEDQGLWKESPIYENKNTVLKELTLKNIEIFEIEQIIKEMP